MTVHYTDPRDVVAVYVDPVAPRHRRADGYGDVPTRYRVRLADGRTRRVYVRIYGNSGSPLVNVKGDAHYLDTVTEHVVSAVADGEPFHAAFLRRLDWHEDRGHATAEWAGLHAAILHNGAGAWAWELSPLAYAGERAPILARGSEHSRVDAVTMLARAAELHRPTGRCAVRVMPGARCARTTRHAGNCKVAGL